MLYGDRLHSRPVSTNPIRSWSVYVVLKFVWRMKIPDNGLKGHPHASIMYQDSEQNSQPYEVNIMGGCVNIMGSCVSFQIKVQILAFYLETHATTHNIYFIRLKILPRNLVHYTGVYYT